jgi:hypothetical protein
MKADIAAPVAARLYFRPGSGSEELLDLARYSSNRRHACSQAARAFCTSEHATRNEASSANRSRVTASAYSRARLEYSAMSLLLSFSSNIYMILTFHLGGGHGNAGMLLYEPDGITPRFNADVVDCEGPCHLLILRIQHRQPIR